MQFFETRNFAQLYEKLATTKPFISLSHSFCLSLKAEIRFPQEGASGVNSYALYKIHEDPAPTAPTSSCDKNLSVRSGIEKCLTSDFPEMLVRVPQNILGKVNKSLFYKLQVRYFP